jgi:hypothetical protein
MTPFLPARFVADSSTLKWLEPMASQLKIPTALLWEARLHEEDKKTVADFNASLARLDDLRAVKITVSDHFAHSKTGGSSQNSTNASPITTADATSANNSPTNTSSSTLPTGHGAALALLAFKEDESKTFKADDALVLRLWIDAQMKPDWTLCQSRSASVGLAARCCAATSASAAS